MDAETQSVIFASGVAEDAQLPVDLDFVAVNIELEDFEREYQFTVFDHDVATTQDFIAVGLPFKVSDHVDAERPQVDITDGHHHPCALDLVLRVDCINGLTMFAPLTSSMANHKSALKRIRSNETKRLSNRYYHKTMRNALQSSGQPRMRRPSWRTCRK